MKTLLSLKIWLAFCLLAVSTVGSAGILWESTQPDSDFIVKGSGTFGIFSASEAMTDSNATLITGSVFELVTTEPFKIALKIGTDSWITESSSSLIENTQDNYLLVFLMPGCSDYFKLIGIDIGKSTDPVTGVPLPASIWFMTSALLGLLYTGRRKGAIQA